VVDHVSIYDCNDGNWLYAYKHLETIPRPEGDWERWVGDYNGGGSATNDDEGHFYMECSNQGMCDRSTGQCQCFDGYTGLGCNRFACPEDCSGHGRCLDIEQARWSEPTLLDFTCQFTSHSKTVTCDGDKTRRDAKLAAGDWIQVKGFPPMTVATTGASGDDTLTLDNDFPEDLPYGTEVYVIRKYKLWDLHSNRMCQCDPRWTGADCSLRKCPRGDDPLTSYKYLGDTQPRVESVTTGDDSTYTQDTESQTLTIDSDHGVVIGHFTLTFTDYYGDEFTTKPIPTEVQLSCSISTSSATVTVDTAGEKGCPNGLPVDELTRGDAIRIGAEYRTVREITFKTVTTNQVVRESSKTYIASFVVSGTFGLGQGGLNAAQSVHKSGTRLFRRDVSKEIREALEGLPNNRIEGVSVENVERAGDYHTQDAAFFTIDGSNTLLIGDATGPTATDFQVHDIVRVEDEFRRIEATTTSGAHKLYVGGAPFTLTTAQPVYVQNGYTYRIRFESGCSSDADCNSNGVDSDDSDAGAICTLGGTCLCSDVRPSAEGDIYRGRGCTKLGTANHGGSYKRTNSGNIPLLRCDKSRLFGSWVHTTTAVVRRTEPTAVVFESALAAPHAEPTVGTNALSGGVVNLGDMIYIDGQVREVSGIAANTGTPHTVYVSEPFYEYDESTQIEIVPARSSVYILKRDGGVGIHCSATDLPELTTERSLTGGIKKSGDSTGRTLSIQSASGTDSFVRDAEEVHIGDRIRIRDDSNNAYWETRTVDSITYAVAETCAGYTASTDKYTGSDGLCRPKIKELHFESAIVETAFTEIYVDNRGTTEQNTCSDRGICDESTGLCGCFRGYTDDDCSRQDALSAGGTG